MNVYDIQYMCTDTVSQNFDDVKIFNVDNKFES